MGRVFEKGNRERGRKGAAALEVKREETHTVEDRLIRLVYRRRISRPMVDSIVSLIPGKTVRQASIPKITATCDGTSGKDRQHEHEGSGADMRDASLD